MLPRWRWRPASRADRCRLRWCCGCRHCGLAWRCRRIGGVTGDTLGYRAVRISCSCSGLHGRRGRRRCYGCYGNRSRSIGATAATDGLDWPSTGGRPQAHGVRRAPGRAARGHIQARRGAAGRLQKSCLAAAARRSEGRSASSILRIEGRTYDEIATLYPDLYRQGWKSPPRWNFPRRKLLTMRFV